MNSWFDALTKHLSFRFARRRFLAGIGGGVLTGLVSTFIRPRSDSSSKVGNANVAALNHFVVNTEWIWIINGETGGCWSEFAINGVPQLPFVVNHSLPFMLNDMNLSLVESGQQHPIFRVNGSNFVVNHSNLPL